MHSRADYAIEHGGDDVEPKTIEQHRQRQGCILVVVGNDDAKLAAFEMPSNCRLWR